MSLPQGSTWLIKRTSVPDQKIEITFTSGEKFTAKYIDITDPSEFVGEVWARERTMINIKQHNRVAGYVAFHSGLRREKDDEYVGSWYDVAGHSGGEFLLTKL
jgi:type IV secretory pathway component VirB8